MDSGEQIQLKDGRSLTCVETVRLLPGKRQVFMGDLDGAPVFAKLYLDSGRRQRHWQRELDGINAFLQRGILTAELLYAGVVGSEELPLILLAQLPEPVSFKTAWDTADDAASEQLLRDMAAVLAGHHMAGVCQADLHLDNFVISGGRIYSLDGAGVSVVEGEVELMTGLDNLALFLAQLLPKWDIFASGLYDDYLELRGLDSGPSVDYLLQQVKSSRERRWSKFRSKLFRDCTAIRYRELPNRLEIVARAYVGPDMDLLLSDPDASFPGRDKALKNGSSCTVWATKVNEIPLVVKRYNDRGVLKGLGQRLFRSRAISSWENANMLLFYGISTPAPVAVLTQKQGIFRTKSYFIAEATIDFMALERFQDASVSQKEVSLVSRASHWFIDKKVAEEKKEIMADKIAGMFRKLEQQHISHGDMKASNIIIAGDDAFLIDLDSMRHHKWAIFFIKAWKQDIRRFMSNWDGVPMLKAMFWDAFRVNRVSGVE